MEPYSKFTPTPLDGHLTLDDYPVLDEDHFSQLEHEEEEEVM